MSYHARLSETSETGSYLEKARESLAGAESEFANGRFQNCANRAYYACYQAAVAALFAAGIRPRGDRWGHDTVQALFVGELINRRKRFPAEFRDTFDRLYKARQIADYSLDAISEIQAFRSLRRARSFVGAIHGAEKQ